MKSLTICWAFMRWESRTWNVYVSLHEAWLVLSKFLRFRQLIWLLALLAESLIFPAVWEMMSVQDNCNCCAMWEAVQEWREQQRKGLVALSKLQSVRSSVIPRPPVSDSAILQSLLELVRHHHVTIAWFRHLVDDICSQTPRHDSTQWYCEFIGIVCQPGEQHMICVLSVLGRMSF